MSDNKNSSGDIFHDEWRTCLQAHYHHVVSTGDSITEESLRHVLLRIGFTEDDIDAMKQTALRGDSSAAGDHEESDQPRMQSLF